MSTVKIILNILCIYIIFETAAFLVICYTSDFAIYVGSKNRFLQGHIEAFRQIIQNRIVTRLFLIVFPFFAIIIPFVVKKLHIFYKQKSKQYLICYCCTQCILTFVEMIILIFRFNLLNFLCVVSISFWITLISRFMKKDDGGDNGDDKNDSEPNDPTPTGDAVEQWLKTINRVENNG